MIESYTRDFDYPNGPMSVDDWKRLFLYLKRKEEISIESTKPIEGLTKLCYFVGLVLDTKDEKFKKICKIESYDWKEFGDYYVVFADRKTKKYSDESKDFKIFYRRSDFLNKKTQDSFNDFLLQFYLIKGDFKELKSDYSILFNEDLPRLKSSE